MPTAPQHLDALADPLTQQRLRDVELPWDACDGQIAAALRFHQRIPVAPVIVGLIGGASSGKSTLFNTLIAREVSRSSACAHETLGPVAATMHPDRVQGWMTARLLLPDLRPIVMEEHASTIGQTDALMLCGHDVAELDGIVLVDTPDVTSQMSADEGALTRALLPWFDALIVVVDEERWFDAVVFEDTAAFARDLGPRMWIVFNNTASDSPLTSADGERLSAHAAAQHADGTVISPFQPGAGYRPLADAARSALIDWMRDLPHQARSAPLTTVLGRRCGTVLGTNVARSAQHDALRRQIDRAVDDLTREATLTTDLLTTEERGMLGLGHRYIPLYDLYRYVRTRWQRVRRPLQAGNDVDFEKDLATLTEVLQNNFDHRFSQGTARIDRLIAESPYVADPAPQGRWDAPPFDAREWAARIRAHIDAWKVERQQQARRSDWAAAILGGPLLVADLLVLGGAGMTLTWSALSLAGFLGGKGISQLLDKSPAFAAYQTTVHAYQSMLREALTEQAATHLAALPRRHLAMSDPVLAALLYWSSPARKQVSG